MTTHSRNTGRHLTYGLLIASFYISGATQVFSLDARVKMACAGDYFAHCSAFSPTSPEVRKCMRAVGPNLSKGCINALRDAGEISSKPARSEIITVSN